MCIRSVFNAFFKFIQGTFTGPQIKKLLQNEEFTYSLDLLELDAFEAMKDVIANFLGGHKADNYKELIQTMLAAFHARIDDYEKFEVHMSLKIHFLAHHVDFFPENLGNSIFDQFITFKYIF